MATSEPISESNLPGLGSLAQAARSKQIKSARTTLIVIGVLTLVVNAGLLVGAKSLVQNQVDKEVKELTKQGNVMDPVKLQELTTVAVRTTQFSAAGFMAVGLLFIVFGLLVYRYPVPITVSALVLYLACGAISAALDPASLAQGFIVKIIIIVALAKAIKSAVAYQREQQSIAPGLAG